MRSAFDTAQRYLGATRLAVPGKPKGTLLNFYFRRAVVDGMTDPFFLETLVVSDLLPLERPFVTAHEWAHLAGYNDEGEANFVGWLTCMRADEPGQYSAWMFLFNEAAGQISASRRVRRSARGWMPARARTCARSRTASRATEARAWRRRAGSSTTSI